MKKLYILAFFCFLAFFTGHAQSIPMVMDKKHRPTAKDTAYERKLNIYANRKYSYGLSENFYGFHPNSTIYHATDVVLSERFDRLDIGNFLSFELTGGASFQPYQGFRAHVGFDYELLTPTKVHFYFGTQYALGLMQRTIADNQSSVTVGYHNYIVPFIGVMYWPGGKDITKLDATDPTGKSRYYNPTFWQLVYIKAQISCSALFSKLSVTNTEGYDTTIVSSIRQNVSSGLYLSIGVGINLPTFGKEKLTDLKQLHYMGVF